MSDTASRLIDQFGNPIRRADIAALREQIAAPDAAQGRPPFQGHLAFGMNPQRMGAVLQGADSGNSLDWLILAEEIEELFPHYLAVLSKRKRNVSQLQITVKAADDKAAEAEKHAEFVRAWLAEKVLARAMFDICDGLGKGFSVSEIVWRTEPGRVAPAEIIYRPQRFFEFSWQDGKTIWLRNGAGYADLVPHKFLVHRHPSKSGAIIRSGLTRIVAWLWMFSTYTLRDWAVFCQAYGLPIRVGRYGPEASDSDKRVLWRAVSSVAGDVAAIIPKSMEMEFVETKGSEHGGDLFHKRADWLNFEVSKLVLGSTAATDAVKGSYGAAKAHKAVEDDVERADAEMLETSIQQQIVEPMISFTFGPQVAYPTITIGQPDQVPLKDLIAAVGDLGSQGLKVKASEILDRLQLSPPEAGDDTIGGTPAPPPAPVVARLPISVPSNQSTVPLGALLRGLITRHAAADPDVMEALTNRLARDAAGAMGGMTEQLRTAFHSAEDLHDLARRVHALKLSPDAFADAMARGMALAHLVGQAALVEELRADDA